MLNLKETFGQRFSKKQSLYFSQQWSENYTLFLEGLNNLQAQEIEVVFHITWVYRDLAKQKPEFFSEKFELFFKLKDTFYYHEGIMRNFVGVLQDINIPEIYQGLVYDFCFKNIENKNSSIAVKVFSMTVCFNIAKGYHPELLKELSDTITLVLKSYGSESPAIFSRSNKILNKIKKLTHLHSHK